MTLQQLLLLGRVNNAEKKCVISQKAQIQMVHPGICGLFLLKKIYILTSLGKHVTDR